jgi:hypothetical protein
MILLHLDLPNEQRTVFAVVIEKANLDRMKEGDPCTLEAKAHGGMLPVPRFPANLSLLIAYLEDTAEFYKLAEKRDPQILLAYLERNRQWKPEVDGVENVTHLKDFGKHTA